MTTLNAPHVQPSRSPADSAPAALADRASDERSFGVLLLLSWPFFLLLAIGARLLGAGAAAVWLLCVAAAIIFWGKTAPLRSRARLVMRARAGRQHLRLGWLALLCCFAVALSSCVVPLRFCAVLLRSLGIFPLNVIFNLD